ncbi:hypothetical protein [Holdemania massiliensis]|uniref:hypothetical protein n=1 Tax=Holdemania massiliensis TaxID=1468449 RepID=UPI001F065806|nr:hypothetical protein [Holdemania massiliensis]MCH1939639.1 hypothetical protein [Holdemania massiliensis]
MKKFLKVVLMMSLLVSGLLIQSHKIKALTPEEESIIENLREQILYEDPEGETGYYGYLVIPDSYITLVENWLGELKSPLTSEEIIQVNNEIDAIQRMIVDDALTNEGSIGVAGVDIWCNPKDGRKYCMSTKTHITLAKLQGNWSHNELREDIINRIITLAASMDVVVSIDGRGAENIHIIDQRTAPEPTPTAPVETPIPSIEPTFDPKPTEVPEILSPIESEEVIAEQETEITLDDIKEEMKKAAEQSSNPDTATHSNAVTIPVKVLSEGLIPEIQVQQELIKEAITNQTILKFNITDNQGKFSYSLELKPEKIMGLNITMNKNAVTEIESLKEVAKTEPILANLLQKNNMAMDFSHSGELPGEMGIKINVEGFYKAGDIVDFYYFNDDQKKLEKISSKLIVNADNTIQVKLDHCSLYVFDKVEAESDQPSGGNQNSSENQQQSDPNQEQSERKTKSAQSILKNTGDQ